MVESEVLEAIEQSEFLGSAAEPLESLARTVYPGDTSGGMEDIAHGKWLGHPVHPAVTDVPVGSWTAAFVMDLLEMRGRKELGPGADAAISIGLAGAVVAALTGLADWKYTSGRARRLGTAHAMTNVTATLLYTASLILRKRGNRRTAKALSTVGYGIVSAGAWLGGEMSYNEHVGVNRATDSELPEEWTAVIADNKVQEGQMTRVEADGTPIILVKRGKWISALAATCSHMGGPLDEGTLKGECVSCPWHGSTFNIDDGGVVTGPATYPQPVFEARIMKGMVEIRLARR